MKLNEIEQPNPPIWIPNGQGDLIVSNNNLRSLKGAPTRVPGNFSCAGNNLVSLEYAPEYVGEEFLCARNRIASLHNIHKIVRYIGHSFNIVLQETGTPTHLLGVCLIQGLRDGFICGDDKINQLFAKYRGDINLFQEALIDAGFPEQARL